MPINFAVKLIATVAMEAVQMGLQASRHTYGPRLSETQVTTADYGTPLPRFKGERRFSGEIVWSKDLDIVEHTSKVKGGGKQTNQSALWTAGVAIADCRGAVGPIDKVLKIWFDETLAYDATGSGPISYASSLGIDLASVMRIYLGTDDQDVDPAYADFCEAKYGANSAPAFRGTAMLVFDRMPLDNFGNRPPQISVLVVSASTASYPASFIEAAHPIIAPVYSPDGSKLFAVAGTGFEVFDLPTRTRLLSTNPGFSANWPGAAAPDGYYSSGTGELWVIDIESGIGTQIGEDVDQDGHGYGGGCTYAGGSVWCYPTSSTLNRAGAISGDTIIGYDLSFNPTLYFEDIDGNPFAMGKNPSGNGFYIGPATGGSDLLVDTTSYGATTGTPYGYDAGDAYIVRQSNVLFRIDKSTAAVLDSASVDATGNLFDSWVNIAPGAPTFWNGAKEYSASDLSVLRTIDRSDWNVSSVDEGGSELTQLLYEPTTNSLISFTSASPQPGVIFRYLDRATNAGVTLGTIISAMCTDAGLVNRDTSALTQTVLGYSWTRGDVKSQMEPLLDIHDVDARPHDFLIEFKPRGSAPSGTILTPDFAKNGDSPRSKITEAQDTDLPKLLRINFADVDHDQEANNILSPLPTDAVDTERDVTIDGSTYADTADGMQQKGDRYMRRTWNGRHTIELSLTAQQLAIEPGDVTTLDLDGISWHAKLERQTFVGSRMDCTFRRDEQALATLNSATEGPPMEARDPEVIVIPAPVRGFVIDAPYRWDSDDDARPLLYDAAGAYGQLAFSSAAIWEETGAGTSAAYDQLFATVSTGATWGLCKGTLSDVPSPWLWDRANTLNVALQSGSLAGLTEDDINADPTLNLILIGRPGNWEYVQFTIATLESDGTYTLSGFKRGRRGTEWACSGHAAGEVFVLASSLDVDQMGLDDVGANLSFKAQTLGRSLDAALPIDVEPYQGQSLMPLAPAALKWSYDGTNLTGTITRRTRKGGAWTGGSAIPLGETSEAYEVDVYNGSTFKRTITVSGTNTFTYTAVMAAADGITLPTAPPVKVYQMSDAVGRGFALAA